MATDWPTTPFGQPVSRYEKRGLATARPWTTAVDTRPSRSPRTGWGLDEPDKGGQRPPTSLFSSLGMPPAAQHICYKKGLYVASWTGPQPNWGTNLLPSSYRAGPLSSNLGTKTSRPISQEEKAGHYAWGCAARYDSSNFRPVPRDPIHSCHPDKVETKSNMWSTTSAASARNGLAVSGRSIPVFGEMSNSVQRQTCVFAELGIHPTVK
mgnify:CR=1 FL=1